MKPTEKSLAGWYFLATVVAIFGVIFFVDRERTFEAFKIAGGLLLEILPAFVFIFVLLVLTNLIFSHDGVRKFLGAAAGWKKWLVAAVGGVISAGPIYLWFPFLKNLREHGASDGFLATFLYNRAIKLPLLPIFVLYFGWTYVAILSAVTVAFSIAEGVVFDHVITKK